MDYDFRNRAASPYDYRSSTSSTTPSSHPMYAPPMYPRFGQGGHTLVPPAGRHSSFPQQTSSPSGLGIRVSIKPQYRITPPPQLSPLIGDIPRSNFQFDFDLERKILAEMEKETPNWSRLGLENLPSKTTAPSSSSGSGGDPVVSKYVASGLNRDAVALAVVNYGDNPTKVKEFAHGYNLLREMGFSSNDVGQVLLMYENDTDKALAHLLNGAS